MDTAVEVLGRVPIRWGLRLKVIGEMIGCETAPHLRKKGNEATLLTCRPQKDLARDMALLSKKWFLQTFWPTMSIPLVGWWDLLEVTSEGILVTTLKGKKIPVTGDRSVLAMGMMSGDELFSNLKGKVPGMYRIGDRREPRLILNAIHE